MKSVLYGEADAVAPGVWQSEMAKRPRRQRMLHWRVERQMRKSSGTERL
jgi:hypothetical protein